MKKIVFVSGIQIFPPESGGQLRSSNLCLALVKRGYQVEIYSFTGRKKDYVSLKASAELEICHGLKEYVNRNPTWGLLQFIFYQLGLPPFWLTWLTKFHCPRFLKQKIKNASSVVLDFPFLFPIANNKNLNLIVNTHNAEFELYPGQQTLKKMVKKIEIEAFKKASHVLFCNDSDLQKFSDQLPDLNLKSEILPNGVLLENFSRDIKKREALRAMYKISESETVLLFTGSKYLPNVHAFNFLTKWAHTHSNELVKEKIVIFITGTVSETLVDLPYLKVAGKVPEIYSYFWASDFGLNAVEDGSGTNVKMIEYLAARLPIITTNFGARGMKLVDRNTCLFFDQDNFLYVIVEAKKMRMSQKTEMANKAFEENQGNIDMSFALKNLLIEW